MDSTSIALIFKDDTTQKRAKFTLCKFCDNCLLCHQKSLTKKI